MVTCATCTTFVAQLHAMNPGKYAAVEITHRDGEHPSRQMLKWASRDERRDVRDETAYRKDAPTRTKRRKAARRRARTRRALNGVPAAR